MFAAPRCCSLRVRPRAPDMASPRPSGELRVLLAERSLGASKKKGKLTAGGTPEALLTNARPLNVPGSAWSLSQLGSL